MSRKEFKKKIKSNNFKFKNLNSKETNSKTKKKRIKSSKRHRIIIDASNSLKNLNGGRLSQNSSGISEIESQNKKHMVFLNH
jgi:hypothetical protein